MKLIKLVSMEVEKDILEEIIAVDAKVESISAVLSSKKNVGEESTLGDIAKAALYATYIASERAKLSNEKILVEEDGSIYEIFENEKRFIKKIEKTQTVVPKKFKLL